MPSQPTIPAIQYPPGAVGHTKDIVDNLFYLRRIIGELQVAVSDVKSRSASIPLGPVNTVLHGEGSATPAFAKVIEADQSLSDLTTWDVSTLAHGYVPKAPNSATKFLNGTGAWSIPAGTTTTYADDETPSGTINGSNTAFTLAHTPSPAASLMLFQNGVLNRRMTDYTLSGANITFSVAPTTGDNLRAFYRY